MSPAREHPATLALLVLVPGGLIVYLSFNSGGYFPGATSFAALVLALLLLIRVVTAEDPLAGLSAWLAVAAGALMLYAAWTLASGLWSHSPSRALLEFNRVLLYLFVLLLFGSFARTSTRGRLLVWSLAAGIVVVCGAALATRLYPDIWRVDPATQRERLAYPIGYWNALGLLAGLGMVLCLHLTSSERERAFVRVLSAAAFPLLATTLLFTFSRGALVVTALALVLYALVARPWGLLSGIVAIGVPTAVALTAAYNADLLASKDPTTPAAAAQGHDVALVLALCAAGAALLRALLVALDVRLARLRLTPRARRIFAGGVVALALAAGLAALAGTHLTDQVDAQYKRFTRSDLGQTGDYRDRLTDPGINRYDRWQVALDSFRADPVKGNGAGTYALLWDQRRPTDSETEEGHSLYLEGLAELGVVGMVLLAVALIALIAGIATRARRSHRPLYAAVLVVALAWAAHAAVDWDWEVPAVSIALFVLGGAALAAASRAPRPMRPFARIALGIVIVALAATPALVAVSQIHLTKSVAAFQRGDCDRAVKEADSSLSAVDARPEPYEVLGYCYARSHRPRPAAAMLRAAAERDPNNWQYRYGLALVQAAGGSDPRRAARKALRLNRRELRARIAVRRFAHGGPADWRQAARGIGLSLR